MYPRRYFDDLLLEQKILQQQVENTKDQNSKGSDQKRFLDLILNKVSLGIISAKPKMNEQLANCISGRESVRGSVVARHPLKSDQRLLN